MRNSMARLRTTCRHWSFINSGVGSGQRSQPAILAGLDGVFIRSSDMATQQFNSAPPPARANRWQDWANLVLAIWLFISPWVLQFAVGGQTAAPGAGGGAAPAAIGGGTAAWDAWVLGVIIFLVAV